MFTSLGLMAKTKFARSSRRNQVNKMHRKRLIPRAKQKSKRILTKELIKTPHLPNYRYNQ